VEMHEQNGTSPRTFKLDPKRTFFAEIQRYEVIDMSNLPYFVLQSLFKVPVLSYFSL
jgi:hypothetical protein